MKVANDLANRLAGSLINSKGLPSAQTLGKPGTINHADAQPTATDKVYCAPPFPEGQR